MQNQLLEALKRHKPQRVRVKNKPEKYRLIVENETIKYTDGMVEIQIPYDFNVFSLICRILIE